MLFELHHPPGPGHVSLSPLTGRAELSVTGLGAKDAIALIDACLAPLPGMAVLPGGAVAISTSDRDRMMAALYAASFGEQITGNTLCTACEERFDFDFDLSTLLGALKPSDDTPDPDGWYRVDDVNFRVPTGADELAAAGLDANRAAEVIALRCAPDAADDKRAVVEAHMGAVAPLIDLTLGATCPDCGHENPMAFRAERYMLTTILNQRHAVLRDIHQLAATYAWSFAEITDLPRDTRQALVAQIQRDRSASVRVAAR